MCLFFIGQFLTQFLNLGVVLLACCLVLSICDLDSFLQLFDSVLQGPVHSLLFFPIVLDLVLVVQQLNYDLVELLADGILQVHQHPSALSFWLVNAKSKHPQVQFSFLLTLHLVLQLVQELFRVPHTVVSLSF